jgi:hypothetical protein
MINELIKQNPQVLEMWGADYIKILTKHLLQANKRASGKLINSLDHRVRMDAEGWIIEILGEDYLEYVDQGVDGRFSVYGSPYRYTNKMPPVSAISKWCDIKGISRSAAFAIAKNIFKFGIEPTYVIQNTEREFKADLGDLVKVIEQAIVKKYKQE